MLKVLHIVTHMNRGGLETMIMNYYRKIDRNIIQFDFLVHRQERGDYDDEIEKMGGIIYRLPALNPLSFTYRKRLKQFYREHNEYSIVHSHLDCMSSLPLKYAKKYLVPIRIAHSHNISQEKNAKYVLKIFYKHMIPLYANYYFACSDEAGKWMFGTKDFILMRNAIDSTVFDFNSDVRNEVRREFGISDDELVIGHIGRFNHQKNHKFLFDVFKELIQIDDNARLLLVGNINESNDAYEQCNKLGILSRTIFTGVRGDINRIIQGMDFFVFPSLFEGLPVTLVEVQSSGLPCVISDKVPAESILTKNLVSIMSLSEPASDWAQLIISRRGEHRYGRVSEIKNSGFDIIEAAKWLEKTYQDMYNKTKACSYNE